MENHKGKIFSTDYYYYSVPVLLCMIKHTHEHIEKNGYLPFFGTNCVYVCTF